MIFFFFLLFTVELLKDMKKRIDLLRDQLKQLGAS